MNAKTYYDAGLNVIPLKADGSKSPFVRWKQYITQRCPWYLCGSYFVSHRPVGIGIVCGETSGNLLVIDFDDRTLFPWWSLVVTCKTGTAGLDRFPRVFTPEGVHVYVRTETPLAGEALALDKDGEVAIETRGHGQYVVAPGSHPNTHPTGRPYRLDHGDLGNIPTITEAHLTIMLDAGRQFSKGTRSKPKPILHKRVDDSTVPWIEDLKREFRPRWRPGDDFNNRATWESILEPKGWAVNNTSGDVTYWTRPGKGSGVSASTDFCKGLYVFSSSTEFEPQASYSKFAAFAILYCDGDFSEASKELARRGYGRASSAKDILNDNI